MTNRRILHVDMDAFFASVEVLDNPELRGKPLIVGGAGQRGVVASCTYEARAYGIRSAMPSGRAARLCPHAVFMPGRYHRYVAVSRDVHQVFEEFTPLVESIGLDEAFLDVSGAERLFGDAESIGWKIRERMQERVGLACSVGVAETKFVAKLASEHAKPRATLTGVRAGLGVWGVYGDDVVTFLHGLPVRALGGVGPKAAERLERLGVTTVKDLAELPLDGLSATLGFATAAHLHNIAWGRDDRDVVIAHETKSVGHEQTYPTDLHGHQEAHIELLRLADAVSSRLRKSRLDAKTITLKVRFLDFATITRSRTLPQPVDTARDLLRVADELIGQVDVSAGVRLLGIHVSQLGVSEGAQLMFDGAEGARDWDLASDALDAVRARFGDAAVGPAALLANGGPSLTSREGESSGRGGPGKLATPSAGGSVSGDGSV